MADFPAPSHFYSFLESFRDPLWVVNRAFRLVYFNPAAAARFGLSRDQVIGKICHQILFENPEACPFCEVSAVFTDGCRRQRTFTLLDNDGRNRVYALSCHPLKNLNGAVDYVLSISADNTEGVDMFAEISRLKGLAAMGEYSAELSHEIRNPLNSIEIQMSLLQRLVKELPLETAASVFRVADVVRAETARLNNLAADFLQMKKSSCLSLSLCEAGSLLDRVVELFAGEAASRGVTIRRTATRERFFLRADENQLLQAFVNLVKNALEALREAAIDDPRVEVAVVRVENGFLFTVADNGPGIPYYRQPKIFDLFFTSKDHGTGIGLHLCREIIRAHDGEISFVSDPKGTVFKILMPGERQSG